MPCTLTVQCRAIFLNRLCGDESPLTRCISPICLKGVLFGAAVFRHGRRSGRFSSDLIASVFGLQARPL